MHEHSPITQKNVFLRCLTFLVSPIKVYRYCTDGWDTCSQCGVSIAVPFEYYSPVSSILYFLAGTGISIVMVNLPYLRVLVCLLLFIVFHHVFSAIVLGCFPWMPIDPSIQSVHVFREDARKGEMKKSICHAIGFVFGFTTHYCFF